MLRSPLVVTTALAAAGLLAGCAVEGEQGSSEPPRAAATTASPAETRSQVDQARTMVDDLRVGGKGPRTGYDREGKFGPAWTDVDRNGCGTRDDILARDLTEPVKRSRCVVVGGELDDPYTGRQITFEKADASEVQIDHVVPLSLSWQLGAAQWSQGKRVTFANDPLNLLAVDGDTNAAKSDSGPDAWLPPNKSYRCTYAIRFVNVASSYELRVTTSMKDALDRQLDSCRTVVGEPADLEPLPDSLWDRAGRLGGGAQATGSAADCPADSPVKGNIADDGRRLYHLPDGRWYSRTVPERCFADAAEARDAGFTAAQGL